MNHKKEVLDWAMTLLVIVATVCTGASICANGFDSTVTQGYTFMLIISWIYVCLMVLGESR